MLTLSQQAELHALPLWEGLGANTRVLLTPYQIDFAIRVGNKRQDTAEALRLQNNNYLPIDRERDRLMHIVGALCEMAAVVYFGPIHWNWRIFGITDKPDLSDWIEIKGRERDRQDGWLIVPPKKGLDWRLPPRERAPPSHWAYVLVEGCRHPFYEIVGWRWGHEFLDDDHWNEVELRRRPAWVAKPPFRAPIDLLKEVRLREP